MRALIHGDDKSSWRSPAVQSLDNETDVMRFGRVFFRGQIFLGISYVNIFHILSRFFQDLVRKELRSIAIGSQLHCTVIVSIHHCVHFQLWDHQLKSGRVLKPRQEGRRISMMGLVGQAAATTPPWQAKVMDPREAKTWWKFWGGASLSLSPPLGCEEKAPTYKWPRMENLKWYAHRKWSHSVNEESAGEKGERGRTLLVASNISLSATVKAGTRLGASCCCLWRKMTDDPRSSGCVRASR